MTYNQLASPESVQRVTETLAQGNIHVVSVATTKDALEALKGLIPQGASVMNGSSTTLDQIGFVSYLMEGRHGWNNLHAMILETKDPVEQERLRQDSISPDYFLSSVHAIAETGEVITASATGSQIAPYAYAAKNVIWVASTAKIVPNFDEGMKRIREYVFPLEDQRMKNAGYPGTSLAKILIFMRENNPTRKITLVLVNENLGF